jgi:hypothetical protein
VKGTSLLALPEVWVQTTRPVIFLPSLLTVPLYLAVNPPPLIVKLTARPDTVAVVAP